MPGPDERVHELIHDTVQVDETRRTPIVRPQIREKLAAQDRIDGVDAPLDHRLLAGAEQRAGHARGLENPPRNRAIVSVPQPPRRHVGRGRHRRYLLYRAGEQGRHRDVDEAALQPDLRQHQRGRVAAQHAGVLIVALPGIQVPHLVPLKSGEQDGRAAAPLEIAREREQHGHGGGTARRQVVQLVLGDAGVPRVEVGRPQAQQVGDGLPVVRARTWAEPPRDVGVRATVRVARGNAQRGHERGAGGRVIPRGDGRERRHRVPPLRARVVGTQALEGLGHSRAILVEGGDLEPGPR